ncbi:hypothetical protein SAMN05880582_1011022 [Rhizobium sp. RU20A]|uniref:ATP-binding protein n=1 Tax=Rhizobium sp. RU20A TaxID=1907412 RepID=UPI000955DECD|nr:ATP-binding protein [Rhizobium sp. RU20A]SIQ18092.1 hypothetical protein SAMN05880582_1011022 [Rhizobium sp. RU20A]
MTDRTEGDAGATEAERRDTLARGNRFLGRVVACGGSRATIAAVAEHGETSLTELWSVGRLISISVGTRRVVALVSSMRTTNNDWGEDADNVFAIEVELMGEVQTGPGGRAEFSSGISQYPYLGAIAHRIRVGDLATIYDTGLADVCTIGKLTQDESIAATIHIPSMLSKHFAIVGTTGVGKSTAVTLLLHKAIEADPKLRVLILDPHNEFAAAFPHHAVVIETDTLDLPFWLFKLEEFAEVVFRGRPPIPEEMDILREAIPEAKRAFRGGNDAGNMRRQADKTNYTADTPVPYRMADLMAAIDERIGKLEGRQEKPYLRALKAKVTSAINDPRFRFMFSTNTITDTIVEVLTRIFRIPGDGKPVTTFQLSGIPSEVVNAVASVLCRMAFDIGLWSNGGVHMLVVCEEAHRYIPADPNLGFFPTRQAIARIAKEGRKYGVSLGIITQRPGELDPTILSQCSTVFAMRLANERDQEIIRSALPNSSASTTSFIASIGNGEAIAFGEAVRVPMRMRFDRVSEDLLPRASVSRHERQASTNSTVDLATIVGRMRAAGGIGGPDISAFQNSYMAATGFEQHDDDVAFHDHGEESNEVATLPSYRPAMLPREPSAPPPRSGQDRFEQIRRQILSESAHQPAEQYTAPPADPAAATQRQSPYAVARPDPAGDPPQRVEISSLRESLMKRPLGGFFSK